MSAFGGKTDINFDGSNVILAWRENEDLPRIEHRREPPGGDMQRRAEGRQPVKGQRQRTKPKARKSIRLDRDSFFHHGANCGYTPEQHQYMNNHPVPAKPDRGSIAGRVLSAGKTVQIEDTKADPDFRMTNVPGFENVHTTLGVPLLREGKPIGMLVLITNSPVLRD
jgi:GAF domain-containing protein